jgi:diguanylate cyclase (GGDEF)-like protein
MTDIQDVPFDAKKVYLHIDDQEYRIDRFRANGELILLYDETLSIKMMHEIEVIRSQDYMTKVYNRNYFEMQRKQLEKNFPDLGLIMIDVDGLKMFNDYLGHRAGDRLIARFADILLKLNNIYDDLIPIRFGGDEFVLIAKKADHQKLDDLIKRITFEASNLDPLQNISFSYGLTVRRSGELIFTMLKRADIRLYELKASRAMYKDELLQALKKAQKESLPESD